MTRPINIYSISRIHDENVFSAVEKHHSHKEEEKRIYKIKNMYKCSFFLDKLINMCYN